jgi:hypothetical protein
MAEFVLDATTKRRVIEHVTFLLTRFTKQIKITKAGSSPQVGVASLEDLPARSKLSWADRLSACLSQASAFLWPVMSPALRYRGP